MLHRIPQMPSRLAFGRRCAMTLMEVLIAIFVMGIGLMCVLSLYVLGAARMAVAITDSRVGFAAANAKAIAIAQNIAFDPNITPYFTNPAADSPPAQRTFIDAYLDGPSYAVYVDPVGYLSYSIGYKDFMSRSHIRRRAPSFANNNAGMLKWCFFQDDIAFGPDGKPDMSSGFVERDRGISWAWMLRRPKAGIASCCEITVVIYKQRALTSAARSATKEISYSNCIPDVNSPNFLTLVSEPGQPVPQVQEGSWLLDCTPDGHSNDPSRPYTGYCEFHRIVSVGNPAGGNLQVELGEPLQGIRPGFNRAITVLQDVIEVVHVGTTWRTGND